MTRRQRYDKATYYRGVRMVPYDLLKELALAMAGTLVLILVLAAVLSSPDVASVTIQSWAQNDPVDFVTTANSELAGTSTSSDYGPPYNTGNGSLQTWAFFRPQAWAGVHQPVNSAQEFVLTPLQLASGSDPSISSALNQFNA
ncbi:MAG: cytochrome B6, partial [Candidatus Dormibacteraeota bacterium]|nr:cytochrome B6 [Candidatus Dormibacteraeota bacterium]